GRGRLRHPAGAVRAAGPGGVPAGAGRPRRRRGRPPGHPPRPRPPGPPPPAPRPAGPPAAPPGPAGGPPRAAGAGAPPRRAAPPHPDPLAELTARELLTALDEEIGRLPEAYRLPVILCALEGCTQEEAARRLGWTLGSVKGRLERGRQRLHARLARRGLTLS